MKSKRKHIGHELYPSGRSNSQKNYKNLSTKHKNLTNILNSFKLAKQLKDNKAKLDQQMKLLKENNATLLNYVKSLKLQNEKLNKEQFREYCNDRKLENLFLKLGGIERYLKFYYYQLRKAIKEHENSNCQIETTNLMSKKILDKNLENVIKPVESTASCTIQEESKKDISIAPSVILADSLQMSTRNPSNNSRTQKLSKNSSVKRFKRKNSVENLIMKFLNSVPQYKDRKSLIEKMAKIKKNKNKGKVKRQGSWPLRISTVVKTKRMGAKARGMLLMKLDKLSPAVKSYSRNTNNKVKREIIQRSISNDNDLTKLKRHQADGFAKKNVHNKYIESPRKSVKSDRKTRKKKSSSIKRKHALEKPVRRTIFSLTPRKFDGGTSDSMDSISWDWAVQPPQTLNNAATKVIDSLFRIPGIGLSKDKRRKTVQPHLFKNKFKPHYEKSVLHQVDDIFYDLVEKNNEWQAYVRDLDGGENIIKSHLNEHYIENLRAVLQNQVNRIAQQNSDEGHIRKAKEPWSLFTWSSLSVTPSTSSELTFENQFKQKFLEGKTLDMHRSLFSSEMEKLENEFFSKNIERLGQLIMAREWPVDHVDRQLLNEYARDPQHYNILIMAQEQRSQGNTSLTDEILAENFLYIVQLKYSERRRKKMMESKSFESNITIDTALPYEDEDIQIRKEADLNNSYVAEQRAKWAKYFALREKSPIEQYLAEKKKQKMVELAAIRNNRKQRRIDAKRIHQNSRPLSDLYTAPRLTNRMRKAINDMADKEAQSILRKPKRSIKTDYSKSSFDSNIISDNTSYRSCCSKCNIWPKEKCFLKATPLSPDPVTISFKNCNMDKKNIPDF